MMLNIRWVPCLNDSQKVSREHDSMISWGEGNCSVWDLPQQWTAQRCARHALHFHANKFGKPKPRWFFADSLLWYCNRYQSFLESLSAQFIRWSDSTDLYWYNQCSGPRVNVRFAADQDAVRKKMQLVWLRRETVSCNRSHVVPQGQRSKLSCLWFQCHLRLGCSCLCRTWLKKTSSCVGWQDFQNSSGTLEIDNGVKMGWSVCCWPVAHSAIGKRPGCLSKV